MGRDLCADLSDAVRVSCPYCGEWSELLVDPGGGPTQDYVEDCEVCCRPWSVRVGLDRAGRVTLAVKTLDET